MLRITIPVEEDFDEEKCEFVTRGGWTLELEHSLVSLSKWESKWEKPFLSTTDKTSEQVLDYVRMMVLGEVPPEEILSKLSKENVDRINAYIDAKMTAARFPAGQRPPTTGEVITNEVIYYWMISLNIPFECQYWHLNRLLTLIRTCNVRNAPKKKMSRAEAMAQQRQINAMRRARTGSKG